MLISSMTPINLSSLEKKGANRFLLYRVNLLGIKMIN
jgi:hypothetical protein